MERVLGICGLFLCASEPEALAAWYRDCLGLDADGMGVWSSSKDPEGNRIELWQPA